MSVGNQVEKPRFFIDLLNYQYQVGNVGTISGGNWGTDDELGEMHPHTIGFTPTKVYELDIEGQNDYAYFKVGFKRPISIQNRPMFVGVLGHDWATKGYTFELQFHAGGSDWNDGNNTAEHQTESENIVNSSCEYDGWSLFKFEPTVTDGITSAVIKIHGLNFESDVLNSYRLGCFAMGYIYEPEFNADLALSQSRIMDGVKNKQTKSGKTYSVINYLRPSNWWNGSPFELTDPSVTTPGVAYTNARIGRRSWDLRFSQLSDRFYTDGVPNGVFPANEMVNPFLPDKVNGNYIADQDYQDGSSAFGTIDSFNYNINNDNSLYSTVYHHTLGGTLPFLFSPSPDNSPQNFSICRFHQPGFRVQQKSYKKYNVSMKIDESW